MIRWTWDAAKALENRRKHGVSFELAARALNDPLASSRPDPHPDGDRWQTIAAPSASSPVLLFVVHTEPVLSDGDEEGRIISARVAEAWERRAYADGDF
jgi:uncharacterized DUF497 family protein